MICKPSPSTVKFLSFHLLSSAFSKINHKKMLKLRKNSSYQLERQSNHMSRGDQTQNACLRQTRTFARQNQPSHQSQVTSIAALLIQTSISLQTVKGSAFQMFNQREKRPRCWKPREISKSPRSKNPTRRNRVNPQPVCGFIRMFVKIGIIQIMDKKIQRK